LRQPRSRVPESNDRPAIARKRLAAIPWLPWNPEAAAVFSERSARIFFVFVHC
jgi:hypothetical protein